MRRKLAGVQMVDALASVRLGVALIVAIATVCAVTTFYESRHGTPAAQRDVYQTGWFASLLLLLGVNIAFSVIKRYPWTKHQTGFLMAHVGILILLVGSLVSLHFGLDGSLALYEGEEGDRVSLPAQCLHVGLPGHEAHGTLGVDVSGRPPGPGREQRLAIPGSAATLVVEDSLPNAEVSESIVEGEQGAPALHFSLQGFAGEGWLTAGDPSRDHFDFGPVSFDLQAVHSADELARLSGREDPVNRLSFFVDGSGGLHYVLTSRKAPAARGDVQPGRPIETPWMGMRVIVDRVLPKAVWTRTVVGAPMASIFSVARAPGLPLVYLGTTLICLGVGWMFYVKPWLARHQAARASAVRSAAAGSPPGPAVTAEPASSRA